MSENYSDILHEAKKRYPDSDIRIYPEKPSKAGLATVAVIDVAMIAGVVWLAHTVTPWALLGLVFLVGFNSEYETEVVQNND